MAETTPLPSDPIAEAHRQWQEHGWADAADGMAAVTAIMRTQQILMARIESTLKPFDLTFARFELLRLLSFTRAGSDGIGGFRARTGQRTLHVGCERFHVLGGIGGGRHQRGLGFAGAG